MNQSQSQRSALEALSNAIFAVITSEESDDVDKSDSSSSASASSSDDDEGEEDDSSTSSSTAPTATDDEISSNAQLMALMTRFEHRMRDDDVANEATTIDVKWINRKRGKRVQDDGVFYQTSKDDLTLRVKLRESDSFRVLCAALAVELLRRQYPNVSSKRKKRIVRFLRRRAALADVCVVDNAGVLVGGMSVVSDEMSPLQTHLKLLEEGQFEYVWKVIGPSVAVSEPAMPSAASSTTTPSSISPPRPTATTAATPDSRMSIRLSSHTALKLTKKRSKRRVRKNTPSSSRLNSPLSTSAAMMMISSDVLPKPEPTSSNQSTTNHRGVIDELLTTESEFVADLYLLNAHFAAPLAADKANGRRKLGKTLFQNVADLLSLHAALLVRLRRAANVVPPNVATAFSAWLDSRDEVGELHATYAGGYQRALNVLEAARVLSSTPTTDSISSSQRVTAEDAMPSRLLTDGGSVVAYTGRALSVANGSVALLTKEWSPSDQRALQALHSYVRVNEASSLMRKEPLESFLIRPIQRLMRYPLLLRALRKSTAADDEEHARLSVVIHRIEEIIENVNQQRASRESEERVAEIARIVAGMEKHKPDGLLLRGVWEVSESLSAPAVPQTWYLFENVLVRCVANLSGQKPWKVLDAISTSRLWVSSEHPDGLASVQTSDDACSSLSLVALRSLARTKGVLVFCEAGGADDGDADAEVDDIPLSPTSHDPNSLPSSPRAQSTSSVVDTFGEQITQVGRKLIARSKTPMDARQWQRTVESATKRLVQRVPASKRAEFFAAALDGDLASVRRLLKKTPALWNATIEESGGTVFHALSVVEQPTDEQLAVARFLIRCNANCALPDANDCIPLRIALLYRSAELSRLLLPLSAAVLDARRFGRRLLKVPTGALPPLLDVRHFGASTLHLLVLGGEPLRRLLGAVLLGQGDAKLDESVKVLDGDGRSPLTWAVLLKDARTVRMLLRAQAPINGFDYVACDVSSDGQLLGPERALTVFASRHDDATLFAPVAANDPTTEPAAAADASDPVAAGEGSAAFFAYQIGSPEIAHQVSRASSMLKSTNEQPSPLAASMISPRNSPNNFTLSRMRGSTASARTSDRARQPLAASSPAEAQLEPSPALDIKSPPIGKRGKADSMTRIKTSE